MIEGEGNLYLQVPTLRLNGYRNGKLKTQVTVNNTEIETVATVLRLVGGGSVRLEKPNSYGRKLLWRWILFRRASVYDLLIQVIPFLTGKRASAQLMLEEIEKVA